MNKIERLERGIRKARKVLRVWRFRQWNRSPERMEIYAEDGHLAHLLRSTRHRCSCSMCSQRRLQYGETPQEKRQGDPAHLRSRRTRDPRKYQRLLRKSQELGDLLGWVSVQIATSEFANSYLEYAKLPELLELHDSLREELALTLDKIPIDPRSPG